MLSGEAWPHAVVLEPSLSVHLGHLGEGASRAGACLDKRLLGDEPRAFELIEAGATGARALFAKREKRLVLRAGSAEEMVEWVVLLKHGCSLE